MSVFVGRKRELSLLEREVRAGRLIALAGPSGVGKTTLVRAWAQSRDDAVFMECRERLPIDVAQAIAQSEQLVEADAWLVAAQRLSEEGTEVLVLDDVSPDFGHLAILRNNWRGCIVTTSNHVVEGNEVVTMSLSGLVVPTIDEARLSEAYELFVETARTVDLDFSLDRPDELEAFVELVTRFEGYPLALAIAARRAATLTVGEVLKLLDERTGLTQGGKAPDRHRSLQAALRLTLVRLEPEHLSRLYAMSLFRRPVRVPMLALLLGEPVEQTLEGLENLVRAGLVTSSAFPKALELVARHLRESADSLMPERAHEIEERATGEAFRLAREVVDQADLIEEFGEGPSLWAWLIMREDVGELPTEDIAHALAALLLWQQFLEIVPKDLSGRVEELVEAVDHPVAWLAHGKAAVGEDKGLVSLERAFDTSRTDRERFDSRVALASAHARRLDYDTAGVWLEEALQYGEHIVQTHIIEAEVMKFGTRKAEGDEASRLALEAIELELRETKSSRRRSSLLASASMIASRDASAYIRRSLQEAQRIGIPSLVANAQLGIADITLSESERGEAISMVREARAYFLNVADLSRAGVAAILESLLLSQEGLRSEAVAAMASFSPEQRALLSATLPALDPVHALVLAVAGHASDARGILAKVGDRAIRSDFVLRMATLAEVFVVADLREDIESAAARASERFPDHASLYELVSRVGACSGSELGADETAAYEALLAARSAGIVLGFMPLAESWLERALGGGLERLMRLDEQRASLVVANDASAFRVDSQWMSLADQPAPRALLQAFVDADGPLDFEAIGDALYPDENLTHDSLQNRVNVAISRLRKLGLKPFLKKRSEGFILEGDLFIER